MPQAIFGFLIKLGLSKLLASVLTFVITTGISVGLSSIAKALFGPGGGKPSDGQQTVRSSVGSRLRHYGIVHTGGQLSFFESRDGTLGQVITLGTGEESDILEHRINDKAVTVVAGTITDASYHSAVHIYTRAGSDDQTAISELSTKFPEWTADHRQRGCAHAAIIADPVKEALFSEVYGGQFPQYTQVRKAAKLYDPRQDSTAVIGIDAFGAPIYGSGSCRLNDTASWPWSDTAALVIADYFAHPDGFGAGYDTVNWANIAAEAEVCDQSVTTVNADTIQRWRIWASYKLASDERRQVLTNMLKAIDGFCWQDADEKFNLMVGRYEEPDVVITDDHILGQRASIGGDAAKRITAIKVIYTEAAIGYKEQESSTFSAPDADTRANLNADLAHAAGAVGLVYADATDANNDLYIKLGSSGSGSWTLTTAFHDVISGLALPFTRRAINAVPFPTWTGTGGLTTATNMVAGDAATVLQTDTGTHTDPVVGGTVANAGVYRYSASPAGWQRIANSDAQTAVAAGVQTGLDRTAVAVDRNAATASAAAAAVSLAAIASALATASIAGQVYPTKAGAGSADAAAAAGTIPANGYCYVVADETRGGEPTLRQRVGTASTTTFVSAANSPANGYSTIVPTVASNAFVQQIINMPAPTSGMVNSAGGNDAVNAGVQVTSGRFTNGPVGHENYFDTVVGLYLNSGPAFTGQNSDMRAASYRIESKFAINEVFGTEHNVSTFATDNTEFRCFQSFIPFDKSLWRTLTQTTFGGALTTIVDGDGNPRVSYIFESNVIDITKGRSGTFAPTFRFNDNNRVIHSQINAAGNAYLPLPYINALGTLQISQAIFGNANSPATSTLDVPAAVALVDATPRAGGAYIYGVAQGGVTGDYHGFYLGAVSVSGRLYGTRSWNTHATGAVIHRTDGKGDMLYAIGDQAVGFRQWTYGYDASTGNFIIANPISGMEGKGNVCFGITPQTRIPFFPTVVPLSFANDAAAAAGGVPVGGMYHTTVGGVAGVPKLRLS